MRRAVGRGRKTAEVKQQLERHLKPARIRGSGFVEEPSHRRLALVILRRQPFSVTVTGLFSASVGKSPGFRTDRPPARADGLSLLETGVPRRLQ